MLGQLAVLARLLTGELKSMQAHERLKLQEAMLKKQMLNKLLCNEEHLATQKTLMTNPVCNPFVHDKIKSTTCQVI